MGVLTYFDFLAKFGVGGAHPGGIILTKELLANENISKNATILDAGCGTGQTAAFLAQEYQANVTGIEINPIMIEKAKNRFKTLNLPVKIIHGSVEETPFTDNSFDFVLSESVLAFVNKPKTLKEFYRVLKKGGRFIANEMTINQKLSFQDEQEIKQFYAVDHLLLEEDWKAQLENTGFKNIEIKKQKLSLAEGDHAPEFNFSANFEPELFAIFNMHANMILKYQDVLSYRIITCTK
ncbi:class I SAM-dependent methyltransferase [Bacillus xiapuensis]|uniref:Class I SAM-dependent methyltransferase n=1 Tax=Bacillus xiapuensis TaxID=2014075 RepID=A0ABU6NBM8_9BACI|nr:class I SAM-dependent methyltransferase [Bacillus xiapuensis]